MNAHDERRPSCPVCHSLKLAKCLPGKDRLFGIAPGEFSLLRCTSCGCIFQHPLPADTALAKFYPKDYWWSDESRDSGGFARIFRELEKRYREFVIADHVRFLDSCAPGKTEKLLLDIGCGNGTFLHVAESHGYIPHGMDASARAVEIAARQYGFPVRRGEVGSDAWKGSRFNIITMFHVLEHLPDSRLSLAYARELLRPGGILIIQVPNADSVQARIFGHRWYGLDVPRHVINFTPQSLGLLLQEAGFEFRLTTRFSLRDNPASIASSVAPWLDPIHRKVTGSDSGSTLNGILEIAYLGLFLLSLPAAFVESIFGYGGTIWACATPK